MMRMQTLALTIVVAVAPLRAQSSAPVPLPPPTLPADRQSIQRAALSAFADEYAKRPVASNGGKQLLLDAERQFSRYGVSYEELPRIERGVWPDTVLPGLAAALRGRVGTDASIGCTRTGATRQCRVPSKDVAIIQIGEPVVKGDSATVTISLRMLIDRGRSTNGQVGEPTIVRLIRAANVWKVESVNPTCSVTRCLGAG